MDVYQERIRPLFDSSVKNDAELERAIGIPPKTINKWNSGVVKSYMKYIVQIAKFFNVNADYLLGNTDDPSPAGQKETPTPVPEDGPAKNVIKIAGRDGSFIERQLTDEQVAALKLIVDQLPDADDL